MTRSSDTEKAMTRLTSIMQAAIDLRDAFEAGDLEDFDQLEDLAHDLVTIDGDIWSVLDEVHEHRDCKGGAE